MCIGISEIRTENYGKRSKSPRYILKFRGIPQRIFMKFSESDFRKVRKKGKKFQKRNSNSLSKLSLFQKPEAKFNRSCPLSIKNAPIIDYKNIGLLKKYVTDNNKILSSKITSVFLRGSCARSGGTSALASKESICKNKSNMCRMNNNWAAGINKQT